MGWRVKALLRLGVRTFVMLTLVGAIGVLSAPAEAGVRPDDSKKPSSDPLKKDADGVKKSSDKDAPPKKDAEKPAQAPVKVGLSINEPKAFQGYTLIAPLSSSQTYLLDMQGRVVHSWATDFSPASCGYLLENGHLLRPGSVGSEAQLFGPGPGVGGRIQEFTWDGEVVWDFRFVNSRQLAHHDITPLPNGNILMI